eukprot:5465942-Prymnesium_polylepis.1
MARVAAVLALCAGAQALVVTTSLPTIRSSVSARSATSKMGGEDNPNSPAQKLAALQAEAKRFADEAQETARAKAEAAQAQAVQLVADAKAEAERLAAIPG